MNYHKNAQTGSAHAVIIIVLVVVLLGALGYIFMQKLADSQKNTTDTGSKTEKEQSATPTYTYVDYRVNKKDTSGKKITIADEVDTLKVSDKLKSYFKANVGKEVEIIGGGTTQQAFTIDRAYGDYAAGPSTAAYVIWGPKNGMGDIDIVAGTQNVGFSCEALTTAKVPQELVDGKCLGDGPGGLTEYKD